MPPVEDLPEDLRSLTNQPSRDMSDGGARRELDLRLLIADIERVTRLKAGKRLPEKDASASSAHASPKQWLGISVKTLFAVLAASIAVLVIAEIALGWTFGPPEISLIVLIVLGLTILGARLQARWKERDINART